MKWFFKAGAFGAAPVLGLCLAGAALAAAQRTDAQTADVLRIIGKYKGVFTSPPQSLTSGRTNDGALEGNGDLGVSIGGNADAPIFFFGKNEFWTTSLWHKDFPNGEHVDGGGILPMARLDLSIPSLSGASYLLEENLLDADVTGKFLKGGAGLSYRSWIAATENLHVLELTSLGGAVDIKARLTQALDACYHQSGKLTDGIWLVVSADGKPELPGPEVKLATRIVGVTAGASADGLAFTVPPGGTVRLVTSILSSFEEPDYVNAAERRVQAATAQSLDDLRQKHRDWWKAFYSQSMVELPDTLIEKYYYGSLYLLGCISRKGEVAPGLWGPWSTSHPMGWRGDYTLNYDFTSTFLPMAAWNHIDLAESYDKAVMDWIPEGRKEAQKLGFKGVLYKAHIGPLPGGTVDTNRWSELYCANFAASQMFLRWWHTYDLDYARKIYPFLLEIDAFWQSYLKFENNRYMIYKDEIGEQRTTDMVNNVLTICTLKMLYRGLLEFSGAFGVDADKRAQWQHILDHLPRYTFTSATGRMKQAESGKDANGWSIYPVTLDPAFGMESPPDTLKLAYNTVSGMGRWTGGNWLAYFYHDIARVGYDPATIMDRLKTLIKTQSLPNLHMTSAGGGTENLATVPACINEMLLQSNQGVIRPFSNWPKTLPARFANLRAYGAFLVSSELKDGEVQFVSVASEKGRPAVVRNPWPGKTVALYRNGAAAEKLAGDKLSFGTSENEVIVMAPEGRQVGVSPPRKAEGFSAVTAGETLRIAVPTTGAYDVTLMLPGGGVVSGTRVSGARAFDLPLRRRGVYVLKVRGAEARGGEWTKVLALFQ